MPTHQSNHICKICNKQYKYTKSFYKHLCQKHEADLENRSNINRNFIVQLLDRLSLVNLIGKDSEDSSDSDREDSEDNENANEISMNNLFPKPNSVSTVNTDSQSQQVGCPKCIICLTNPRNVVFRKCGHMVCCDHCAKNVCRINKICPICRVPLQSTNECMPVYLS